MHKRLFRKTPSMKHTLPFLLFILSLCLSFCKKQDCTPVPKETSTCLQAKLDEFKQTLGAEAIVKILRPQGPLYWLVNFSIDSGENVLDENCEVVCITDCECIINSPLYDCTGAELDFPRETIWHK